MHFSHASLFDLKKQASFDYINSIGVLHHLKEPIAGLKVLGSLLKSSGILHIFIYSERGRWEIKNFQNACKLLDLCDKKNSLESIHSKKKIEFIH